MSCSSCTGGKPQFQNTASSLPQTTQLNTETVKTKTGKTVKITYR